MLVYLGWIFSLWFFTLSCILMFSAALLVATHFETFRERLRNEGFVDNSISCLFPRLQPMLGYAATIKIRGSAPPTADGKYPERTDW